MAMLFAVARNAFSFLTGWTDESYIDTHIHVVAPSFKKALDATGGSPTGWGIPEWTLEDCLKFCDKNVTSFAVLSVTAPGPSLFGPTAQGRELCQKLNEEVWDVCKKGDGRFGFFAVLPDFNDEAGTLEEIERIFGQEKRANGVIVMTTYGEKLCGDAKFMPIWEALDRHGALILVHPTKVTSTPEKIGDFLPQPVVDYPLATTRAAVSMIMSGIMTKCVGISVILSHGGGALPYLGQRAVGSLRAPHIAAQAAVTWAEAKAAMGRFYYDIALATGVPQLKALTAFAPASQILYGSDFPYAPDRAIFMGRWQYINYAETADGAAIKPAVLNANARALLAKHKMDNAYMPPEGASAMTAAAQNEQEIVMD